METKLSELAGKIKALNFTITKAGEINDETKGEVITRIICSLTNRIEAVLLKEKIEELKFGSNESEENITTWSKGIEATISEADNKVSELRYRLNTIREAEQAAFEESTKHSADLEREKQLKFQREKLELEQAVKNEERKRELEQKAQLHNQQLRYEKSIETSTEKQDQTVSTKLPKLQVTKFNGKLASWYPFWNTFEAEVDKTDLPTVTKFAYLKEWLEPKVRAGINGMPFTTEGYERAKNILKSEYGKVSEIVNTYVQNIISLPVITDSNPSKVNDFYNILLYNTQALETLKKLDKVSGMARSVLEKLKGIKVDLVRGKEEWQDLDLARLMKDVRKWRAIHSCFDSPPKKNSKLYYDKDGERAKRVCVYCNASDHNSKDCPVVTDIEKQKKMLAEKKLCFNCTGSKHRAAECNSVHKCSKCGSRHHSSICTTKDQLLTASAPRDGPLVYPVVVVSVEGIKCRALLDTAAGNSYASAALLNLLPKRNEE